MRNPRVSRRAGLTLVEITLVVTIIGLISIIGVHEVRLYLDRIAVHNAVAEAATAVARGRDEALARRAMVTLRIDTTAATLALRTEREPLALHALGHAHGVSLSATRESIVFDVRGLGYGAANATLVARRGAATDTLIVSRLGRARY